MEEGMRKTYNCRAMVVFYVVIASLALLSGCGDPTIPSDGTLVFFPSDIKFSIAFDTCFDRMVVAKYKDGTPMEKAEIVISGSFASPRQGAGIRYYFFEGPCQPTFATTLTADPAYRDSGFKAIADNHGEYSFSVLVTALSGSFKDVIHATSGAIGATMDIEMN
jgi:hypothetical protein